MLRPDRPVIAFSQVLRLALETPCKLYLGSPACGPVFVVVGSTLTACLLFLVVVVVVVTVVVHGGGSGGGGESLWPRMGACYFKIKHAP